MLKGRNIEMESFVSGFEMMEKMFASWKKVDLKNTHDDDSVDEIQATKNASGEWIGVFFKFGLKLEVSA